MTTTLNTIKEALEKTIAGLTLTGTPLSQRKLVRASEYVEWADRPAADIDRRFTITTSPDGAWKSFGVLTEHEATTRLVVTVGHIIGQNYEDTQKRRDTDLRKVVLELQDPANRPTGVWRIALVPPVSTLEQPERWITTIRFDLTFSEANP